ncbi:hypothetical protein LCGC14_1490280, partial [marine sediment metagenome]
MARFNAEQKYEAIAMFTKGATLKEVCDETGLADYSARELKLKA